MHASIFFQMSSINMLGTDCRLGSIVPVVQMPFATTRLLREPPPEFIGVWRTLYAPSYCARRLRRMVVPLVTGVR